MTLDVSKKFLIERICKQYRIAKSKSQRLYVLPRIFLNGIYYVFDAKKQLIYAYDPFTNTFRIEKDPIVYETYVDF
jgi:hypothetical protein